MNGSRPLDAAGGGGGDAQSVSGAPMSVVHRSFGV